MICHGCRTVFDGNEEHVSCDICFKVWCGTCKGTVEMLTCLACTLVMCRRCLVAEINYDEEVHTGRLLCQNCDELVDMCPPAHESRL